MYMYIYIYTLLYAHNYTLNYTHILVGGFNPSEKYEHQLGLFFPIYMESHKIPWFQSTNQYSICGGFLKLGTRLDFHEHLMFNQTRCMYIYISIYTHTKNHILIIPSRVLRHPWFTGNFWRISRIAGLFPLFFREPGVGSFRVPIGGIIVDLGTDGPWQPVIHLSWDIMGSMAIQ